MRQKKNISKINLIHHLKFGSAAPKISKLKPMMITLFNFKDSTMLVYILYKKPGKIVQSTIISSNNTIKQGLVFLGFFLFVSLFGQIGTEK